MKLGQFEICTFVEQHFRLDGGTMFGVVPKSLWQKLIQADESNLIPMVTNLFLLKAHGKYMIFDVGLGDTLSDREKAIYNTDGVSYLESELVRRGLTVQDIDYVLLTHLHTDHAGGAVKFVDGSFVPRFPKARYVISKKEWVTAFHADERTSAVYVPERFLALQKADQVDFIDSDTELLEGINAVFTGGHTQGHYALEIESEGEAVFYYADVFCTTAHLRVPYVAATDLFPLETMGAKRRVLDRVADKNVIMAFDHDVTTPLARIRLINGKHVAEPVDSGPN